MERNTTNFLCLFIFCLLFGLAKFDTCFSISSVPFSEEPEGPWFTGPLLTPSARVMPPGHINLEPYLFYNVSTGIYDDHWNTHSIPTFNLINFQCPIKYGLVDKLALTLTPQSALAFTQGHTGSAIADFPIGLEFQIFEGKPDDWINFAKLTIIEIFPTGKYDRLNPARFLTDSSGQGSYITLAGLSISKLFELPCKKYLGTQCNLSVLYHAPSRVRGFSIFGGDPSTKGTVYHGAVYWFFIGAEYTITQKFSLACDFFARYAQRKTFKGITSIPISRPELIQFSLAPAIEYNWNASWGVIAGVWFSIAGRNCERFVNGVIALNYVY